MFSDSLLVLQQHWFDGVLGGTFDRRNRENLIIDVILGR